MAAIRLSARIKSTQHSLNDPIDALDLVIPYRTVWFCTWRLYTSYLTQIPNNCTQSFVPCHFKVLPKSHRVWIIVKLDSRRGASRLFSGRNSNGKASGMILYDQYNTHSIGALGVILTSSAAWTWRVFCRTQRPQRHNILNLQLFPPRRSWSWWAKRYPRDPDDPYHHEGHHI